MFKHDLKHMDKYNTSTKLTLTRKMFKTKLYNQQKNELFTGLLFVLLSYILITNHSFQNISLKYILLFTLCDFKCKFFKCNYVRLRKKTIKPHNQGEKLSKIDYFIVAFQYVHIITHTKKCSSSLWTCLHHIVLSKKQNKKIADFLNILA